MSKKQEEDISKLQSEVGSLKVEVASLRSDLNSLIREQSERAEVAKKQQETNLRLRKLDDQLLTNERKLYAAEANLEDKMIYDPASAESYARYVRDLKIERAALVRDRAVIAAGGEVTTADQNDAKTKAQQK